MSAFEPVPDDKEENMKKAVPENRLTSDGPAEGLWLFKTAFDLFYNRDLSMATKLKQMVEGLVSYRNIFREVKKQVRETEITMCLSSYTQYARPQPHYLLPHPRQENQPLLSLLMTDDY